MKTLFQAGTSVLAGVFMLVGGIQAQDTPPASAASGEEAAPLSPQEKAFVDLLSNIKWEESEQGKLGNFATLKIPEG